MGTFSEPTIASNAPARSARRGSSIEACNDINPRYKNNKINSDVSRASHTHHAGALLAIVGSVNVPIIYFSVKWWNTLHQGSTVKLSGTSMHIAMQQAMFTMFAALWLYAIAISLLRVRSIILERERNSQWVTELVEMKL